MAEMATYVLFMVHTDTDTGHHLPGVISSILAEKKFQTQNFYVTEAVEKIPETLIQTHRVNSSNDYVEISITLMEMFQLLDEYPTLCELKSLGAS